jgi:Cell Wall Hydrolase
MLATVIVAFSPSRWAFSDRAQPGTRLIADFILHQGVTRAMKTDIGVFPKGSSFDHIWATAEPDVPAAPPKLAKVEPLAGSAGDAAAVPIVYFASADPTPQSPAPFGAVLADPAGVKLILRGGLNDGAAGDDPVALSTNSAGELKCLADAIYFEARGESQEGQMAVAQVVINRVKSSIYPNTICGVVYQNDDKLNRCQFSFACDGVSERVTDRLAWRRAEDAARRVLDGDAGAVSAEIGNATHYHATSVSPLWAHYMRRVDTIGHHVFYVATRSG